MVDIGDGEAVIFKMESHNHPSYIEPYQGAATGVGGILRDVFTMGARPIAAMNALRFGAPDHPKTRHLVAGVVAGVGGYGNSFGVPTVGGEVNFHPGYNGNILVNAFAAGIAQHRCDLLFQGLRRRSAGGLSRLQDRARRHPRRLDGLGRSSTTTAEEKRPTVQVGDPFSEKLLLEACLELMASGAVVAIQDMGAAGLTSSAVEMGAKGDLGIELDLDQVPCREAGMTAYEMMLSESQERMLMVLRPEKEPEAEAIFRKWGLDFAIVGRTTDDLRFRVIHQGQGRGRPADQGPRRPGAAIRPAARRARRRRRRSSRQPFRAASDCGRDLIRILDSPDMSSRRWVWEQYDTLIGGDTLQRPGGDAGVVRVGDTGKGLAFSVDVTPRYCAADPVEGGKQAVAECWRNLTAVGAEPLAITDNLNFGNPEKPEIMGELVGAIHGIGEACKALAFPVVSGNVSLYNETNGAAIPPTPASAASA